MRRALSLPLSTLKLSLDDALGLRRFLAKFIPLQVSLLGGSKGGFANASRFARANPPLPPPLEENLGWYSLF